LAIHFGIFFKSTPRRLEVALLRITRVAEFQLKSTFLKRNIMWYMSNNLNGYHPLQPLNSSLEGSFSFQVAQLVLFFGPWSKYVVKKHCEHL